MDGPPVPVTGETTATNNEHSPWKQMVKQIMQEYHLEEKHLQISKDMMKKLLDHMNKEKFQEEIEAEAQNKSKVRKWKKIIELT